MVNLLTGSVIYASFQNKFFIKDQGPWVHAWMQSRLVKWQDLINRHLSAAYLRTQSLLPSTKMQLTRCVSNGIILRLSGLPKNYSNCLGTSIGYMVNETSIDRFWVYLVFVVWHGSFDCCTTSENTSLLCADHFERFLATKFQASKRFGIEGCESLIPGLFALFEVLT